MAKQPETANDHKKEERPTLLGDSLQVLFESFRRADISLPQAIIIAATLIALGLILS